MDTSGVIVLARDADTHRELSRQFQDREVHKTYVAIVGGLMQNDEGSIDIPIRKDMDNPPKQCVDYEQGKPSLTHYEVMERIDNTTRVLLKPVTGRSHQLRMHLKEIGHPILGDNLYAPDALRDASDRLLLHAATLTITHPATSESLAFESACPF